MKEGVANTVLFVCLLALAGFSFFAGHYLTINSQAEEIKPVSLQLNSNETREIPILAIDIQGQGSVSSLTVEIGKGSGQVLLNINDVLAGTDTQQSELAAVEAVESYLNTDFSDKDIIFTIESNANIVSGPSAGSAMAVALYFAATNQDMNSKVAITGAVNETGMIRPVDGLLGKACAARDNGYTLFLIPKEEASYTFNGMSLSEAAGINVIGVSSLDEAVGYFQV